MYYDHHTAYSIQQPHVSACSDAYYAAGGSGSQWGAGGGARRRARLWRARAKSAGEWEGEREGEGASTVRAGVARGEQVSRRMALIKCQHDCELGRRTVKCPTEKAFRHGRPGGLRCAALRGAAQRGSTRRGAAARGGRGFRFVPGGSGAAHASACACGRWRAAPAACISARRGVMRRKGGRRGRLACLRRRGGRSCAGGRRGGARWCFIKWMAH